ncbi:alpha/beta hydrolase [Immundisolibacter sp.]|uniref:alpha/beta fold hydrolase n=1 Tax=Immundisolibacter sp. TaxID=1934948 RepID=UPI002609262C|nr:alpha/beta hydrolase [Immundisolibacter sp.]MDD3651697.1 alpha/beta hydrolase [Immundisolibacter sp.]
MTTDTENPPSWALQALEAPADEHELVHHGVPLRYRSWGTPGRPGLVLVHGAMAHARWWDIIAPRLAADFHVLAPHLSGMGDSGHRDAYSTALFADEVVAAMDHAGLGSDTVVVGHSMGGVVALALGGRHGARVRGVVVLDSPIHPPHHPSPFDPSKAPYRPKTLCADRDRAASRFVLLPPQPCPHPYLLRHVARHSVAALAGGWSWKFDDALFRKLEKVEPWRLLEALEIPLALIYGEQSAVFDASVRAYVGDLARRRGWPMFAIPGGHHHLMLDSPRALTAALHGLLAGWPGPVGREPRVGG